MTSQPQSSTAQPTPPMFSLCPLSEPAAYFPSPSQCRFYLRVHKRMTRRQFQLAVVYTLTTTPGLREWFLSNRSAWERRVDELFDAHQQSDVSSSSSTSSSIESESEEHSCSICLAGSGDAEVKQLHECGHAFHSKCLHQWFRHGNSTCPCCRRVINITL